MRYPPSETVHADPGATIDGKYEILEPLGAGGMGSVYRARHVLTEQIVALKVLKVGPGDEALARRFKLEVSIAAKVKHPGIVKVFDAGTDPAGDRFYLAMELLEGRSLRDAMDDDDADLRALVGHIAEAIDVMRAAHALGVIHRDLKPDNLFLEDFEGEVRMRVLDFGIARDLAGPGVTTTGVAVGTALYMSPEQGTAARTLGPASDIWAFGVMLYEILAGHPPFDGPSAHAVVIEAVTSPHRPLGDVRPDLPAEWSALVDRCLAKKPEARPTSDELLAALWTLLDEHDALDRAIPLAGRVRTGPASFGEGEARFGPGSLDATADASAVEAAPSAVAAAPREPLDEPLAPPPNPKPAPTPRALALPPDATDPVPTPVARYLALGLAAAALLGVGGWVMSRPVDPEPSLVPAAPTPQPRAELEVVDPTLEAPPSIPTPPAPAPTVPRPTPPVAEARPADRPRTEPQPRAPAVDPDPPRATSALAAPVERPTAEPAAASAPPAEVARAVADPAPVAAPTSAAPTPTPAVEPTTPGRGAFMDEDEGARALREALQRRRR